MSAEEIAARSGGETPFLRPPERATVFAERAMRLRQLAHGHAMGDFLGFMAEVAAAQQQVLATFTSVPLPDQAALDAAARVGMPPLPAADWQRDPAWRQGLLAIVAAVRAKAPAAAYPVLDRVAALGEDALERQADALLTGVMAGLDLAAAPLLAAALQVYWTHMVLAVQQHGGARAFGRTDDETTCPGCGSLPTTSVVRSVDDAPGQRYLHCALCSLQWHMVRIKCSHCLATSGIAYLSLDSATADDDGASRAAQAAIQAETCDSCGHYLKIMHTERDPLIEPVADDLASLTLDLLVSEGGKTRHGLNLMLLFGDPPPPGPP